MLRLKGGDDWQRKLEDALRHRACKLLLVANPTSVDRQGVRNEIQIASEVARKLKDQAFIIPLRLAPFQAPFLIAQAQYIDFQRGWARGLAELLDTLEQTYKLPRAAIDGSSIWRDIHLIHTKETVAAPERLISNWLPIHEAPDEVVYYDFKPGISIGAAQARIAEAPWPVVPFRRGFLSFAPIHDLQHHFGPQLPLVVEGERNLDEFLDEGWPTLGIERLDARNRFSDLIRQAFERLFKMRGLQGYALSGGQLAWWGPPNVAPEGRISFRWGDTAGLRQIQGVSAKRGMQCSMARHAACVAKLVRRRARCARCTCELRPEFAARIAADLLDVSGEYAARC